MHVTITRSHTHTDALTDTNTDTHTPLQKSHKMQAAKKRKKRHLQRQQRGILFGACGIGT